MHFYSYIIMLLFLRLHLYPGAWNRSQDVDNVNYFLPPAEISESHIHTHSNNIIHDIILTTAGV